MAKEKVQVTMDTELLQAVDEYCDKHYMNRSWMVSQACLSLVNQQKLIDSISNMSLAVKKAVDTNNFDDETKKQLEEFEALAKMFQK